MEQNGLSTVRKSIFFKEAQTIISVFYLFMVGIGMLFEFQKYRVFNINIFLYADIFDFLIAPFRDYRIFLFVFITALVVFILYKVDSVTFSKFPKAYSIINFGLVKKSWFKTYRYGSFVFLLLAYIILSSILLAGINKQNTLKHAHPLTITFSDNGILTGTLIGKTKDAIFLYSNKKIKIIPSSALIKTVEYK